MNEGIDFVWQISFGQVISTTFLIIFIVTVIVVASTSYRRSLMRIAKLEARIAELERDLRRFTRTVRDGAAYP